MAIGRFVLRLADGRTVAGAIHGSGGLIADGMHNVDRVEAVIRRANRNRRLDIYEPKPGHVRIYTNATALDAGDYIDVDLRGAVLLGAT